MPSGGEVRHDYHRQDRGRRLSPGRRDTRYWHLRLMAEALASVVASDALPRGERLLDYGCGNKPYATLFRDKFPQYVGADLPGNPDADLVMAPDGVVTGAEAGAFDCVLSTQVLEHVPDPAAYLAEAHRVLKPDGRLLLTTHGIWVYHPDPNDFWRWTTRGLDLQLARAGFEVTVKHSVMGLASCAVQLWQDATARHLPRLIRAPYTFALQQLIGLVEWHGRRARGRADDASVFVIVARKLAVPGR